MSSTQINSILFYLKNNQINEFQTSFIKLLQHDRQFMTKCSHDPNKTTLTYKNTETILDKPYLSHQLFTVTYSPFVHQIIDSIMIEVMLKNDLNIIQFMLEQQYVYLPHHLFFCIHHNNRSALELFFNNHYPLNSFLLDECVKCNNITMFNDLLKKGCPSSCQTIYTIIDIYGIYSTFLTSLFSSSQFLHLLYEQTYSIVQLVETNYNQFLIYHPDVIQMIIQNIRLSTFSHPNLYKLKQKQQGLAYLEKECNIDSDIVRKCIIECIL